MARRLLCFGLGILLVGCAASTPDGTSGVEGLVRVGPMCPVVQAGVECPDAPLEADLVIEDDSGRVIARARSSAAGAYRIALDPGSYVLVPQSPPAGLPFAAPAAFEVPSGAWTVLDITYDSGIR
jgi:hypothetical protein